MGDRIENVVIIGSGPAGFTAAIYAARANLKPLMFEGQQAGGIPGGQLMTTTEVENFPGFPEGITGPELMDRMKAQAIRWGTECYTEDVIAVDLSQRPFTVKSTDREVKAHSIIIATGATAKRLHLPSETTFWNKGISACAICDGASPLFSQAPVAVVGGGDSATEEAVYLTKYADHVHLLVRRGELRASKTMQDRAINHPKITVHWHTEPVDVYGDDLMQGMKLRDTRTGEERDLAVQGLFYAIGHTPNTVLFQGQLALDEVGYIATKPGSGTTSVAGVFAAGDVQDHEYRQAITAAGSGCAAALLAERFLSEHNLIQEFHQTSTPTPETPKTEEKPVPSGDPAADFNPEATKHHGGYALRKLFHGSDRLLMVKYVSPTCGPCRSLGPILDKVVAEFEGQLHFIEIDIMAEPDIARMGQVTGTPTVQFFKNKEMIQEFKGVKPKSEYREAIAQHI